MLQPKHHRHITDISLTHYQHINRHITSTLSTRQPTHYQHVNRHTTDTYTLPSRQPTHQRHSVTHQPRHHRHTTGMSVDTSPTHYRHFTETLPTHHRHTTYASTDTSPTQYWNFNRHVIETLTTRQPAPPTHYQSLKRRTTDASTNASPINYRFYITDTNWQVNQFGTGYTYSFNIFLDTY